MRVLVVEDQALIALALTEALVQEGHHVIGPARTSEDAIRLGRAELPQIAFLDIDLEDRGVGLEVARRLQEECNCAVILTTGRPELARTCTCALGLMSKPYDFADAPLAVDAAESLLRGATPARGIPRSLELLNFRRD